MKAKLLFSFLVVAAFISSPVYAEEIKIKLTKIVDDLYKLEGKSILLQTLNCDAIDQSQDPFLKIGNASKKIVFRESEVSCDVVAAYKRSTGGVGSYSVVIAYALENWYGILGTSSYIRTKQCSGLFQRKKAVLSLSGRGLGTLHIGRTQCQVEGVYTKLD